MKIAKLAGKGFGVLATQTLKPGQLILQEYPLVRVDKSPGSPEARANPTCAKLMGRVMEMAKTGKFNPRSDFSQWPIVVVSCFEGILDEQSNMAYAKLDKGRQKQWMELSDVHAEDEARKSPGGILRTNAIDDAENYANLYAQLSRMNHSCAPNAIRISTDKVGGVAVLVAHNNTRGIDEGEEVLISYTDGVDDGLPVEERRKHLMQQYHFHCMCNLCLEQENNI